MLKEKEVDVENKLMYVNSNYRKKETFYKTEMTKFQKDLEVISDSQTLSTMAHVKYL